MGDVGACKIHVEVVKAGTILGNKQMLLEFLKRRKSKINTIYLDGRAHVDEIGERLIDLGFPKYKVVKVPTSKITPIASSFVSAIQEETLTHFGQDILNKNVANATKTMWKDGRWSFTSKNKTEYITALEASALAYSACRDQIKANHGELKIF